MTKRILGISRSPRFSPNSTARDEAIFQEVFHVLQGQNLEVHRISEDAFVDANGFDAVFSMARAPRVLEILGTLEDKGIPVVNSARALLRDNRLVLTQIFEREGIPVPSSALLFSRNGEKMIPQWRCKETSSWHFPFWLKRTEACAQSAADVCYVENEEELVAALTNYVERGVNEVLACEHLQGDLVKFYGVEDTDFFYSYYPTSDNAFSKFGLEKINGAPSGFLFDVSSLKQCADHAAALCGISVYGGDCIVDKEGHFRIIDFNDWPSYSRCCERAAQAIAEKIIQQIKIDF